MLPHRQTNLVVSAIILLAATLLSGYPLEAARPLTLRVLGYNIHHGEGVD